MFTTFKWVKAIDLRKPRNHKQQQINLIYIVMCLWLVTVIAVNLTLVNLTYHPKSYEIVCVIDLPRGFLLDYIGAC